MKTAILIAVLLFVSSSVYALAPRTQLTDPALQMRARMLYILLDNAQAWPETNEYRTSQVDLIECQLRLIREDQASINQRARLGRDVEGMI